MLYWEVEIYLIWNQYNVAPHVHHVREPLESRTIGAIGTRLALGCEEIWGEYDHGLRLKILGPVMVLMGAVIWKHIVHEDSGLLRWGSGGLDMKEMFAGLIVLSCEFSNCNCVEIEVVQLNTMLQSDTHVTPSIQEKWTWKAGICLSRLSELWLLAFNSSSSLRLWLSSPISNYLYHQHSIFPSLIRFWIFVNHWSRRLFLIPTVFSNFPSVSYSLTCLVTSPPNVHPIKRATNSFESRFLPFSD